MLRGPGEAVAGTGDARAQARDRVFFATREGRVRAPMDLQLWLTEDSVAKMSLTREG
ncbi:hypothetical protein Ssi02_44430 [Sinosporangium siamense]|uniref:Uncharacterized protein n=1 Tax=Sinosporangium siamense TaxID=1367973 RepID=A0A919RJ39_9ACTN|nr:hypothetical protein Ssi02_44430 [Sinosporangium siamense]